MTNGAVKIEYEVTNGYSDDLIRANVAYSSTLGLPDVEAGPVTDEVVYLYANGPSAAAAPKMFPSLALNGAMLMFIKDGFSPTWWAACDPGEVVYNFVRYGGHALKAFFVASKCSPRVFDRLAYHASLGRVKRWHIDDASADVLSNKTLMPSAISVTISAIFLLYHMGYRKIVTYGWDGCYAEDGRDHAAPQHHDTSADVDVDWNGRLFRTTDTWLAELEDATEMLNRLPDLQLTIEGPGLIAAALQPFLDHMIQTQRRSTDANLEECAARVVRPEPRQG